MMTANEISKYIINRKLKIIAKPNSPKTEVICYDENRKALKVNVAAAPEKDKANKEIIKFFSKLMKKKTKIIRGLKSREKVLEIE